MTNIAVDVLERLPTGHHIDFALAGGSIRVGTGKDGSPAMRAYTEGALFLVSPEGETIVGPIQPQAAIELALAIATGNPRALTEPQASLILATMLLAALRVQGDAPGSEDIEADAAGGLN